MTPASQRYAVVDVDSHLTEPATLWTDRISTKKWGDLVPHVKWSEYLQKDRWYVGETRLPASGASAYAGWTEFPPSAPPTLDDVDPASFDPKERVKRLDEYGVAKQVLYPNLLGFYSHVFASLDPQLSGEIVRAYNDFQTWFSKEGDDRFIALTCLPYWDIDASVKELERCVEMGHRGLILGIDYPKVGIPSLREDYWAPVLDAAQSNGLPINFHIGFAASSKEEESEHQKIADRRMYCKETALFMLGNANAICEVIVSGLCERYPQLNFVSVESGAGFIPFLLQSLDWQWLNSGARNEYPTWLLPSEYFRRQIFGTFWFEGTAAFEAINLYPDNIMFETDFPHPTSLSPGPNSSAPNPKDMIDDQLSQLPEDVLEKVLSGTANRIYNLA